MLLRSPSFHTHFVSIVRLIFGESCWDECDKANGNKAKRLKGISNGNRKETRHQSKRATRTLKLNFLALINGTPDKPQLNLLWKIFWELSSFLVFRKFSDMKFTLILLPTYTCNIMVIRNRSRRCLIDLDKQSQKHHRVNIRIVNSLWCHDV